MAQHQFVICISNSGYGVSLEPRKLYQILPYSEASKHHQVRIIDEFRGRYLYPKSFFIAVSLPEDISEQLARAA